MTARTGHSFLHGGAASEEPFSAAPKDSHETRRPFRFAAPGGTQKRDSEAPFEGCPVSGLCTENKRGPACALEGLFEGLPRFLPCRVVPGCCRERADFISTGQQTNR